MAEYLSEKWFAEVAATQSPGGSDPVVVLQQVVTRDDAAEVSYQVRVGEGWTQVVPGRGPADATFTGDWPTAVAIASGALTPYAALAEGRIRVSGNLAALGRAQELLRQADPVPPTIRAATTY